MGQGRSSYRLRFIFVDLLVLLIGFKGQIIMLDTELSVLNVLVHDANIIPYRKEFNRITGSVTASILLQQIIYRCGHQNTPFYKFKEPCEHELYQADQSWTEELGFSRREFDTAIAAISTKIKKGDDLSEITTPVVHWTTIDRITYYQLNLCALRKVLNRLYVTAESAALIKAESACTDSAKAPLVINNREVPENTENKKINKKGSDKLDEINEVFLFWQEIMKTHKAKLDAKRSKMIKLRLQDFSVQDLKTAILGCSKSKWHMGANPNQTAYNQISNIFGSIENVEKFIDMQSRKRVAVNDHDLSTQSYDNAQEHFDVPVNQFCI